MSGFLCGITALSQFGHECAAERFVPQYHVYEQSVEHYELESEVQPGHAGEE